MRNVLLISIDDLFSVRIFEEAFGLNIHSPNLDLISAQGMSFTNAFCTTALCTPSRTAVLSGLNPFETGVQTNAQDWNLYVDPMGTLPALFKEAGYVTSSFGKTFPTTPNSLVGPVLDAEYDQALELADRDDVTDDYVNVHKAIDYLNEVGSGSQPYFMMMGLHDPHGPQTSPQKYYDLYPLDQISVPVWEGDEPPEFVKQFLHTEEVERLLQTGTMDEFIQSYLANISEMDARLGELLDAVEGSGTDPIIVLYSDHGYSLGDHDHVHKFTLWEQTTQVPFVIYDSQSPRSQGVEYQDVVSLIDLGPTVLEMSGLPIPGNWDGDSLADIVRDPTLPSSGEAMTTMFGSLSLRTDDWRITRYEDGTYELFNIRTDPDNSDNLANEPAYENQLAILKDKLFASTLNWGVAIDDSRNLITVTHDDGSVTYYVGSNTDLSGLQGTDGVDMIYASVLSFTLPEWAEQFTASLRHSEGVEVIGNSKSNEITGTNRIDLVYGMDGDDFLFLGRHHDTADGGPGNDYIDGNKGDDRLFGGDGVDILDGNAGHDWLDAGGGNDRLNPNVGRDTLTGGEGADRFAFKVFAGDGDTVTDFERGIDKVKIKGESWDDLEFTQVGTDLVASVGGHQITFLGISQLTPDDFR